MYDQSAKRSNQGTGFTPPPLQTERIKWSIFVRVNSVFVFPKYSEILLCCVVLGAGGAGGGAGLLNQI